MNDPPPFPPPPGDSYGQSPAAPPPGGPPAGGPPAGHRPGLAWEQSKDANSLLTTVKRLITSPGAAFDDAREKGDYASPLLFAVVLILVGAMFAAFWQLLISPPDYGSRLEELGPEFAELATLFSGSAGASGVITTLIFAPLFGIIGLFIWSGIVHLTLSLLGGLRDSTAGFEGTFRATSYSYVAQLGQLVPLVGGLLTFVWSVALQMIGLSSIHRTSQGKAIAAVLIPFFVCCCVGIGLAVAFAGVIAAAIGAGS